MKRIFLVLIIAGVSVFFTSAVSAQTNEEIAKAIMAMAKGQWAQENSNPGKAFEADIAEDYTEFNQDFPVRLDGRSTSSAMYEALSQDGSKGLVSDMSNAKVQVYNGDVAILTYNYIGVNKLADGKTEPSLAKSTRVYVKVNGKWKLVHANFAPVTLRDD